MTQAGRKHFAELDGLRGFATLVVVTTHCWFYRGAESGWILLDRVRDNGWISMDTFFALSGFLITGILLDSVGRERYWRNFFVRRALRVFPLYYLVMALLFFVVRPLASVAGIGMQELAAPAWSHFLYVSNFFIAARGDFGFVPAEVSWSLCIEEQFYTLWPLLVALLSRRAFVWTLVAICALSPLARLLVFYLTDQNMVAVYVLTFTRMDAVAYGALAAVFMRRRDAAGPAAERRMGGLQGDLDAFVHRLAVALWVAVAVMVIFNGFDRTNPLVVAVGYSLTPAATAVGIVSMLNGGARYVVRFLQFPAFLSVGRISYAVYLSHVSVLVLVNRLPWTRRLFDGYQTDPWVSLAHLGFVVGISLAIGALSWRVFESRLLGLKDRLAPYQREPDVAPGARP